MSQYFYGKNVVRQLLEDHAEVRMVDPALVESY